MMPFDPHRDNSLDPVFLTFKLPDGRVMVTIKQMRDLQWQTPLLEDELAPTETATMPTTDSATPQAGGS